MHAQLSLHSAFSGKRSTTFSTNNPVTQTIKVRSPVKHIFEKPFLFVVTWKLLRYCTMLGFFERTFCHTFSGTSDITWLVSPSPACPCTHAMGATWSDFYWLVELGPSPPLLPPVSTKWWEGGKQRDEQI